MSFKAKVLAASAAVALLGTAASAEAQVEINWWHAMGGELGDRLNELAEGFNASQSDYVVRPVYRGNYTETMTAAIAANQSVALINAYRLTQNPEYLRYALANLDYILVLNDTGYSFVTGHGDRPTMHPHHRPSEADDVADPVPGLLAGGPNPGQQDGCEYPASEPARSYVDDWCSYASNEIAINWNAPLAYVAMALEALQAEITR